MKALSKAAVDVPFSPVRQMFDRALGMTDVISFTVGEPDFYTPEHIVEAAVDALHNGQHKYTPNAGILPLRQTVAESTQQTHGISYDPNSEIIITSGGTQALSLAMLTLLDPGDEMILSDPCWTNYYCQVQMYGAVPKFISVNAENNFHFEPDALEAAITPKTKAFILNSPANPTGGVADPELVKKLADIAIRHDLYVISDEVYADLTYDGSRPFSIATLPGMKERTIIINSFSKTYAMCGWRVAWAMGPAEIVRNMVKLQENVVACVNSAAQYGAIAALKGTQEPLHEMQRAYARRRDIIVDGFNAIPGLKCFAPQGAFYAFVDISATGMKAMDFAVDLLDKAKVIVVPGHAFGPGSDRYVRLVFATSEENIREGLRRIGQYMSHYHSL